MDSPSPVAVLTGDLIDHVKLGRSKTEAAMAELDKAAKQIALWTGQISCRFTRFRGDGWQLYLTRPQLSMRAAVVLQGRLMAIGMASRISIGVGASESLGTTNLADASGPAFENSGRGLDSMGDAYRLHLSGDDVMPQDILIGDLIGERMEKWTAAQAEAASLHLGPDVRTLFDIGKELGISPQAVNDRLKGAGCHTLGSVLRRWEKVAGNGRWDNST
jgi:hypothetical protein